MACVFSLIRWLKQLDDGDFDKKYKINEDVDFEPSEMKAVLMLKSVVKTVIKSFGISDSQDIDFLIKEMNRVVTKWCESDFDQFFKECEWKSHNLLTKTLKSKKTTSTFPGGKKKDDEEVSDAKDSDEDENEEIPQQNDENENVDVWN